MLHYHWSNSTGRWRLQKTVLSQGCCDMLWPRKGRECAFCHLTHTFRMCKAKLLGEHFGTTFHSFGSFAGYGWFEQKSWLQWRECWCSFFANLLGVIHEQSNNHVMSGSWNLWPSNDFMQIGLILKQPWNRDDHLMKIFDSLTPTQKNFWGGSKPWFLGYFFPPSLPVIPFE